MPSDNPQMRPLISGFGIWFGLVLYFMGIVTGVVVML